MDISSKEPNNVGNGTNKFPRKCYSVRLTAAEMDKCRKVQHCLHLKDISKTIRLLIEMAYDSFVNSKNLGP